MAGDFSCTEMGPGEVTGQDGQEERRVTACFLDIPAPGLRVRSLGGALSRLPVGSVSLLSGRTSDQTFISTNTAVVVTIQTLSMSLSQSCSLPPTNT